MSRQLRNRQMRRSATRSVVRILSWGTLLLTGSLDARGQSSKETTSSNVLPQPEQLAISAGVTPMAWFADQCERDSDLVSCSPVTGYMGMELALRFGLSERWNVAPVFTVSIPPGRVRTSNSTEFRTVETERSTLLMIPGLQGQFHPFYSGLWFGPRAELVVVRDALETTTNGASSTVSDYALGAMLGGQLGNDFLITPSAAFTLALRGGIALFAPGAPFPEDGGVTHESGPFVAVSLAGVFGLGK